ncbi:MAG: N-(5'-phosphoribosyl)anthranilate isomerase [Sphingomonadales bacterium RIFCSPHIGHO2_01_FULL_65_20]|jgi:phosphoribosylanthranilate isomerase|uniref:phosphoribosylanthranilate isomerase n=1 Tax=unclassified Blastomonas TaxID=2626550 RepID=UPI00082DF35F|nr:phosphoribosylanthranilate isomerase [Blastomonas sp.]MCH2238943.1 phosphoribosylanthranilate isomerase [Blastomonas sp.]OHC92161.1 MAG: N-(5'-phosphoribosyl)anthranilate isomerase [Sphingomonadales bacterium RIFCSPHIGHO2_01_FULL_65_20]
MTTLIKICGLSTEAAIDTAAREGATHIGLVHFEKSPRHVTLEQAAELRRCTPSHVKVVLLLVNASPELTQRAQRTVRPDVIQFHGSEKPEWLRIVKQHMPVEAWKALGLRSADTLTNARRFDGSADRLLFDAPAQALPGGNGSVVDWSLLVGHHHALPWGLAGGLNPDNVREALAATQAPLVDVSSGVESAPGVKDMDKIARFCQAVRDHDQHRNPA